MDVSQLKMFKVDRELISWSDIPMLALASIAKFLQAHQTDLISFRSVCSSWRNSAPCCFLENSLYPIIDLPLPDFVHGILFRWPMLSNDETDAINFTFSRSIIYLLEPISPSCSRFLLVKAEHQVVQIGGKHQHKEYDWNMVKSIGDRLFFIGCGFNHSFSISGQDFSGAKGNCIFFKSEKSIQEDDVEGCDCHIGVYNVENGKIVRLTSLLEFPDIQAKISSARCPM
ncbi:conserved hypothetical protein [Ricinus communis]|uniref:KIB1-4 beta-propeller domain-containing protein n=1 Tax=Ricinus communis TaxID=3988 RepID=B9S6Q2_RICCO|nr:conserved hypothetical protein [Ricinus communis]